MAQSFLYVDGLVHVDLCCPALNPGSGQTVQLMGLASTLITLRNRDGDTCFACVKPE
jgi:hypothetical protein